MNMDWLTQLESKVEEFKKLYEEFSYIKENLNNNSYNYLLEIKEHMLAIQKEIAELKAKIQPGEK